MTFRPTDQQVKTKVEDFWPELLEQSSAKKKMFEKWAGSDFQFTEKLFELMCQTYAEEFFNFVKSQSTDQVICSAIVSQDPSQDLKRLADLLRTSIVRRDEIKVSGFAPVFVSWKSLRVELDCELNFGNFCFK